MVRLPFCLDLVQLRELALAFVTDGTFETSL